MTCVCRVYVCEILSFWLQLVCTKSASIASCPPLLVARVGKERGNPCGAFITSVVVLSFTWYFQCRIIAATCCRDFNALLDIDRYQD